MLHLPSSISTRRRATLSDCHLSELTIRLIVSSPVTNHLVVVDLLIVTLSEKKGFLKDLLKIADVNSVQVDSKLQKVAPRYYRCGNMRKQCWA